MGLTLRVGRWLAGVLMAFSLAGWLWGAQAQAVPAPRAPTHQLELGHTFVYWEVLHMGTSTVRGRFDRLGGQVVFNPQARLLEVEIVVDSKSVSTGSQSFDNVLRGPNLLATIDHPQAVFKASQSVWEGPRPTEVTGQLSLSGVTRPLTLTVVRWKCALNPLFRAEVCGGDLEATLSRGEFSLGFGAPWVSDEVKLRIQVEAVALPPVERKFLE